MEARPQSPLLISQAWSWIEGVSPCDSNLLFVFFGWVGWKECQGAWEKHEKAQCLLQLCLEKIYKIQFSSVAQSCPTLCDPMNHSTPGLPVHHHLLEFTQTYIHWVGDAISHLILCCPLLFLPSLFPSIKIFSNELALHIKWPKSCSFNWVAYEKGRFLGLTPDLLNQNLHLN